jgi:hypothetical protein
MAQRSAFLEQLGSLMMLVVTSGRKTLGDGLSLVIQVPGFL